MWLAAVTRHARYAVRILGSDRFVEYSWHRDLEMAMARAAWGISVEKGRDVFDRKEMRTLAVWFPGETKPFIGSPERESVPA